ncbi:ATP synthase [Aspergillus varians]
MSSLRFARSALRARPAAFRVPLQRRGYAEAVSDKIKLSLALPHQTIFKSTGVVQVNIPAESGEMGVLANHVPSIEQLKPGLVEILEEGGASKKFFLSGGFAVVQPDSQLSINAVEGYPLEDFSADNVRAQIAEAQKIASGNGSEQDIAEAKIELEVTMHRFHTMTEELPTNLPASFSHEIGLMEENDIPSSYFLDSPRRWHAKATLPKRQGSASPSFTQNRSRLLDRLSGDEDYKDLLFTFPRVYSDFTSERDPFFDIRAMPLNPHNTPISQSGRQSQIGSCGKDKRNAPSPVKSDMLAPDQLSDAGASSDNPLTSLFNGDDTTWRPPKPLKPSFLSGIDIPVQRKTENIRPSFRVTPPRKDDDKIPLPETPYRSLPLRGGRNIIQSVERPATDQSPERRPAQPKHSWETRTVVPCRYFPRPFTRQELEILGIPLNNTEMPFPAPIPTIDKLPLRRGIINFDWKQQTGQYPVGADNLSTTEIHPPTTTKGSPNSAWGLSRNLFSYLTPWKQERVCTIQNPIVRTTITVPFASRCETCPAEPEQVSVLGLTDGAYVLQIGLAFPLLFVSRTTLLAAVIRGCISSKIALTAAFIVRSLVGITIRGLLSVFQIGITVEVKRA